MSKSRQQDIRILSLYKQHYFDRYEPEMDNQYSCLGYYDGISITEIDTADENFRSVLFAKRSKASISPIWCGTTWSSEALNGKYGKQNIGIFRCVPEAEPEKEHTSRKLAETSPFFLTAFIQLTERNLYTGASQAIESLSFLPYTVNDEYAIVTPYFSYDNADLIILIYSNRLKTIQDITQKIEAFPEVRYLHSILGISEAYLTDCGKNGGILSRWHERKCYIDDNVQNIILKVASSGSQNTIAKLRGQFQQMSCDTSLGFKGGNNIKFLSAFGHENFTVNILKTDVRSLLALFLPNGLATHGNPLFGKEIYNIETSVLFEPENYLDEVEDTSCPLSYASPEKRGKDKANEINSAKPLWFAELVKSYEKRMTMVRKDEGLYSYYCALVQVANTLAQYEGFSLSRDIFLLIFPSFKMFDSELNKAMALIDKEKQTGDVIEYSPSMLAVKEAICEFVNAVNSIVYHTIHTDQIFLMVPGYSGTTYSIPVKLCLVYLDIISNVITILNDADHKYSCLLRPELETRPTTTLINVIPSADDRQILFSSSQRSLYMPRHFIILLTHEIAHYVGDDIRNRSLRLECICKTLAYLLATGIFSEKPNGSYGPDPLENMIYKIFLNTVKSDIELYSARYIYEKVEKSNGKNKEHTTEFTPIIKAACYELLEEKGEIRKFIHSFPKELKEQSKDCDTIKFTERLNKIQLYLDKNRRRMLSSNAIINESIDELIRIYQEIFSDVAAAQILNFKIDTFSEVFQVSEGNIAEPQKEGKTYDIQRIVRERIMENIIGSNPGQIKEETISDKQLQKMSQTWPFGLPDNLFLFKWTGEFLLEYARASADSIRKRLESEPANAARQAVKNIYDMFKNDEKSCEEIYAELVKTISAYDAKVQREHEKALQELEKQLPNDVRLPD